MDKDVEVHFSTVCKTKHFVMDQIIEKSPAWIQFPSTARQINGTKILRQSHFKLPTVIGAMECTPSEITIVTSLCYGDEYVNRKGYTSIKVQPSYL